MDELHCILQLMCLCCCIRSALQTASGGSLVIMSKRVSAVLYLYYALLILNVTPAVNAALLGTSSSSNSISTDVATVDPPIRLPDTAPVVVPLFTNVQFTDFVAKSFSFVPPSPTSRWSKIVFSAHFKCTAGRQFDRTCSVFVGNANVFFGTTAEPSSKSAPEWSVQRDLTDYAELLRTGQDGKVSLGNLVDSRYTGILSGSAEIDFYPPDKSNPPADSADLIIPLNELNAAAALHSKSESLNKTIVFPTNCVRVTLDVIAESQANDEFWYTDVPDDDAAKLGANGGTGFREVEVSVDGRPAGLAPVFPWIYTGGIDPNLWKPIPGVQTLNFTPYRINLTPFAGLINDGRPHTVSVSVFNARDNFATAATLLVSTDPKVKSVIGKMTRDTLGESPRPDSLTASNAGNSDTVGPISVMSNRTFIVSGYVLTSRGKVETTIQEQATFANVQWFVNSSARQEQKIEQETITAATVTTAQSGQVYKSRRVYRYRLGFDSIQDGLGEARPMQYNSSQQTYAVDLLNEQPDGKNYWSADNNTIHSDTSALLNAAGSVVKFGGSNSLQRCERRDSNGESYDRIVAAMNGRVVLVK